MSVPEVRQHNTLPIGIWKLLLLLVAVIGLSLLVVPQVYIRSQEMFVGMEVAPILAVAFSILAQTAIMFGLLYVLAVRTWRITWRQLGARPADTVWYGYAVLLAFLAMILVALVSLAIERILGETLKNPQVGMLAPMGFSWFSAVVMLVLAAGVAPLVEEFFFRGLVHRWFSERSSLWIALPVSSLIFAVLHGLPQLIAPLFVIGCLLAWLYEKCRSIWPCVVMHAIFNGAMLVNLYAGLAAGMKP